MISKDVVWTVAFLRYGSLITIIRSTYICDVVIFWGSGMETADLL